MTSEPEGTPRRRPPTIDLTATEVESAAAPRSEAPGTADKRAEDAPDSSARTRRGFSDFVEDRRRNAASGPVLGALMGAALGAVAMIVIFVVLWGAGFVPAREAAPPVNTAAAPAAAPATDPGALKEISTRLDKIEAVLAARAHDTTLTTRMSAEEAENKSQSDALAALNQRLDEIAALARAATARADAAASAADATKNAAPQSDVKRADLDALAGRLSALEGSVKSLAEDVSKRSATADDRAARAMVAAAALQTAIARGAPFTAELAAVKSFGVEQNAIAALAPFAETGVPSARALAHELEILMPDLRRVLAPAAADQTSLLGRLEANARRLVRITPIDAPVREDASAAIAKINAAAAQADVAAALAAIAQLPDPARSLAAPWVKKAEAREAALAASRRIATQALAALSGPASQ